MPTYTYNNQDYEFDDGVTPDDAMKMILEYEASQSFTGTKAEGRTKDISKYNQDPDFVNAARVLRRHFEPNAPEMLDDNEAAEYGKDKMAWVNNNLPSLGINAAKLSQADANAKKAFLYLLERYDEADYSWEGFGRAILPALSDPTNIASVGSLGLAAVGKQAASVLSKQALKQALRQGVITGIDTGLQAGARDVLVQNVEKQAGAREDYDLGRTAGEAAIGAGAGAVLGGAADLAITGARQGVRAVMGKGGADVPSPSPHSAIPESGEAPPAAGSVPPVHEPTPTQAAVPDASMAPGNAIPRRDQIINEMGLPVTDRDAPVSADDLKAIGEKTKKPPKGTTEEEAAALRAEQYWKAVDKRADKQVQREERHAYKQSYTDELDIPVKDYKEPILDEHLDAIGVKNLKDEPLSEKDIGRMDRSNVIDNDVYAQARHNRYWDEIDKRVKSRIGETEKSLEGNPLLDFVRTVTKDEGWAKPERAADVLSGHAERAFRILQRATPDQLERYAKEIIELSTTGAQSIALKQDLMNVTELALRQVKDGNGSEALWRVLNLVRDADLTVSSHSGTELGARNVGLLNTGETRALSPESYLEGKGIDPKTATPEQLAEAREWFREVLADAAKQIDDNREMQNIKRQISDALANGDLNKAVDLDNDRAALADRLAQARPELGPHAGIRIGNAAVEVAISNVLSTSTLTLNTVPSVIKMVIRPAMEAIARDATSSISWKAAGASYAAMAGGADAAFRAALLSFKYERALIGTNVLDLPSSRSIPGMVGGVIRTVPRLLQATDEAMGQLFYRSYVAGKAVTDAYAHGMDQGLTGSALENYVKVQTKLYTDRAFSQGIDPSAISLLRSEGAGKGLKGADLTDYVKKELNANPDLFRKAQDEGGLNYVKDALFKREFSDDTTPGKLAKGFEQIMNASPLMKLAGQLFFRTPVRVFEEGVRLTPGANMLLPSFLNDLRGVNGEAAFVRAQGEAMLSIALGTTAITMYGLGNLTGGGPEDPKLNRAWQEAGNKPYTMKIGSYEFNYRNFDPIAAPFKIIVNALDAFGNAEHRRAQGVTTYDSAYSEYVNAIALAGYQMVRALRDANLWEGVGQMIEGFDKARSEDGSVGAGIYKWIAEKANFLVPNTVTKGINIAQDGER